jgi:hypothetical protein
VSTQTKPKEVTESAQSATSGLLETSEDEEHKKKEAEAKKKGQLTPAQLNEKVEIIL